MKTELTLNKGYMTLLVSVLTIFAAIVGVIAYHTNNPAYFGHPAEQLDVLVGGTNVPLLTVLNQIDTDLVVIETNVTLLNTTYFLSLYQPP